MAAVFLHYIHARHTGIPGGPIAWPLGSLAIGFIASLSYYFNRPRHVGAAIVCGAGVALASAISLIVVLTIGFGS